MIGLRLCLVIALAVGAMSNASAVDYTVPAGVTILTEEQLLTQIIGNTFLRGTSADRKIVIEYFEPPTGDLKEGKLKGYLNTWGPYSSIWTINGAQMCWQHDKPASSGWVGGCFTVALDGDTVTRYKANGEAKYERGWIVKLVPGNPENL